MGVELRTYPKEAERSQEAGQHVNQGMLHSHIGLNLQNKKPKDNVIKNFKPATTEH